MDGQTEDGRRWKVTMGDSMIISSRRRVDSAVCYVDFEFSTFGDM